MWYFSTVALTYKCAYAIVDLKRSFTINARSRGNTSLRDDPVNSNMIRTYVPSRVSSCFTTISHAHRRIHRERTIKWRSKKGSHVHRFVQFRWRTRLSSNGDIIGRCDESLTGERNLTVLVKLLMEISERARVRIARRRSTNGEAANFYYSWKIYQFINL